MKKTVALDGTAFPTHKEVLKSLGIGYPGKIHQEGAYALFDGWRIWFPNMTRQNGDWLNRFSDGETAIEENYVGSGDLHGNRDVPDKETKLIVFPKLEEGYVFKGVFEVERVNERTRRYRRCAESCEISFDARPIC